jgi:hypothetical protein
MAPVGPPAEVACNDRQRNTQPPAGGAPNHVRWGFATVALIAGDGSTTGRSGSPPVCDTTGRPTSTRATCSWRYMPLSFGVPSSEAQVLPAPGWLRSRSRASRASWLYEVPRLGRVVVRRTGLASRHP